MIRPLLVLLALTALSYMDGDDAVGAAGPGLHPSNGTSDGGTRLAADEPYQTPRRARHDAAPSITSYEPIGATIYVGEPQRMDEDLEAVDESLDSLQVEAKYFGGR